ITRRYTLSLHDALPIYVRARVDVGRAEGTNDGVQRPSDGVVDDDELGKDEFPNIGALDESHPRETVIHESKRSSLRCRVQHSTRDRKSTRLNSSHVKIS